MVSLSGSLHISEILSASQLGGTLRNHSVQHFHFVDEETQAIEGKGCAQGHSVS